MAGFILFLSPTFPFFPAYVNIAPMLELKAKNRIELGRKVNALRRAGFLPAVVYGEGISSQPISVSRRDFERTYRSAGESTIIKLKVEDGNSSKGSEFNVLIHDIENDPLRGEPLHADFYAVRMDRILRVKVPLEFIHESPAVKNEGGILIKVVQELEVEALPKDLPRGLTVDLSLLKEIGSRILVKNISLPSGVKIISGDEDVLAIVEAPRSEEELAALKETLATEIVPPEVKTEREVKKEQEAVKEAEQKTVAGGDAKE